MKPFLFGSGERRLYGVYHAPSEDRPPRGSAVLIAAPWQAEYNATHRVLKNLASQLAEEGFPTLRFDYYGSGDSDGATGTATLSDHVADFRVAREELAALSGLPSVTAIGRGLGAVVALRAASEAPLREVVLWEPVVFGRDYLRALAQQDAVQRRWRLLPVEPGFARGLLGFFTSREVLDELRSVDARRVQPRIESRALVVAEQRAPAHEELVRSLRERCEAQLEIVGDDQAALARSKDAAVLAAKPLRAITEWVVRGAA